MCCYIVKEILQSNAADAVASMDILRIVKFRKCASSPEFGRVWSTNAAATVETAVQLSIEMLHRLASTFQRSASQMCDPQCMLRTSCEDDLKALQLWENSKCASDKCCANPYTLCSAALISRRLLCAP